VLAEPQSSGLSGSVFSADGTAKGLLHASSRAAAWRGAS